MVWAVQEMLAKKFNRMCFGQTHNLKGDLIMDGGNWEPKKWSRLNMLMSGMSLLQWWKVLHVNGGEGLFN
jgi:hypothetical protein